jgi:hypothetical protein
MLPEVPYEDLVRGLKSKWVKKQPRNGSLHGLDASDRIHCIRDNDLSTADDAVYEQFLIHEENGFWCVFFDDSPQKSLLGVKWFEMQGERWLRSLEIRHNGIHEFTLQWEGDRFLGYVWRAWEQVTPQSAKPAAVAKLREQQANVTRYRYTYSADGELEKVTEESDLDNGETWAEVKYQRIPRGADLKSLLREAEELLVAEIPRRIAAAKVKPTVYALLVQFTGVDTDPFGFAPPLFLPTEELRQRLLEKHPKEAAWYLWAVPEWQNDPGVVSLACENPALDEKLHLIFQLTITQPSIANYGPVRKMFQRVCARLNALDWHGLLNTTDDFVVFPFDTHGELDSNRDLKASVPVEKLRLLIERGRLRRMKLK